MDIITEFDSTNDLDNFDDDLNEKAVEKIKKVKEFKILEKLKIFVFFDKRLPFWFDKYNARIYPTDYPSFNYFIDYLGYTSLKNKILSNDFDFVIHIQRKIKKDENKVLKIIDLAHEFQHIVQYTDNLEIFCISDVLYQASKVIKEILLKEPYPLEIEAIKVSKKISYDINKKDKVDSFAQAMLNSPNAVKNFWENFILIDVNTDYDPKEEIEKIWIQYKPKIEKKILEINNKLQISKGELLKTRFEFYLKIMKEHHRM